MRETCADKMESVPRDWHVSISGEDSAMGTVDAPLRHIQHAAELARPGDRILIHAGTYRERVDPPCGGSSEDCRIVYQAAGDGLVEIKGSEIVDDWRPGTDGTWTAELPNEWFGDFNPYQRTISGHWFFPNKRLHHPGAVYLDGHWLIEAASLDEVLTATEEARLWFAEVGDSTTKISARFGGKAPRDSLVEINVRQTVFYPSREGRNFITVRGLTLLHAATPWAPPTTEQIGLIGCHWAKGWIIEDCVVRYSACAGITLGKYHDPEDFPELPVVEHTNGEDTYHGTIRRALAHGWSLETIGGHVVRNCVISHCEMAGICGSLGAPRSIIEGNIIHDIHVHRLFNGFEQAGIKFHGAIDTLIRRNRIFRCNRGIWLDWMSQGTRVSRNVCYANGPDPDLFAEVNHGPFMVDGNFFLSGIALLSQSDGGIYIRNVFLGRVNAIPEPTRTTPYFQAHSTQIAGWSVIELGDDSYYWNIFAAPNGLSDYDRAKNPLRFVRNTFLKGSKPSTSDQDAISIGDVEISYEEDAKTVRITGLASRFVEVDESKFLAQLAPALVSRVAFENQDDWPLVFPPEQFEISSGGNHIAWG